ncbi:MAG: DUF2911 domain-containing protein [Flavobacteriaceae bacterium]
MKRLFSLPFPLVFMMTFTIGTFAQDFQGLDKSPMDMATFPSSYRVQDKAVRVTYSRPQLKGRDLSQLAPAGKVWRTGANEAAEITFYKDAQLGDKSVKAGTYALFTIPGENEWTIILNSQLNQWGAYSYSDGADVVRVSGTVSSGKKSLEAFSIAFDEAGDGAQMVMGWGTTRVNVPLAF